MNEAVARATDAGYLGDSVCGSGRAFYMHIRKAAGSYVCGEETAMLESIEGKRGIVRAKPPLPAIEACSGSRRDQQRDHVRQRAVDPGARRAVLSRLRHGRSQGTLPFQLAGNIKYGGLVEKAFRHHVARIAVRLRRRQASGRPIKAVQVGGPLGTYLPESQLDIPLDYEAYAAHRAGVLGHGGIVVFDDTADMVANWRATRWSSARSSPAASARRAASARPAESRLLTVFPLIRTRGRTW